MLTWDGIVEANNNMPRVPVKNKQYACVPARVQAFRKMCPNGSITTDIVSMVDGVVVMKATVYGEDGNLLGSGLAYEKESSSFINKTSYIENCETSAVGRALGFLGLGSDENMASTEEAVNAISNQTIDKNKVNALLMKCKNSNVDATKIYKGHGIKDFSEITENQFMTFVDNWEKVVEKYGVSSNT